MTYDGIQYGNRVDTTSERKLAAYVVDNVLNTTTFGSRQLGLGASMEGKTQDYTIKITDSGAGEWFIGLETLNSAASDTTITLSYAHNAFHQPEVSLFLEALANAGPTGTINLQAFKKSEAIGEAANRFGKAIYGTGANNQILGLGAHDDDGTDVGTIGGQSRTTYLGLKATRTAASSGVVSLTVLATLNDTIRGAGLESEEPNINVTTKTIWSLYEQLLAPAVRNNYEQGGGQVLPLRGRELVRRADLEAAAGFTSLAYRGRPVIADDNATSGNWWMLNENYLEWRGRTVVPDDYQGKIERVTLGEMDDIKGVAGDLPPKSVGWFYQPKFMLPNQAGQVGRFFIIGQFCGTQPRRQGRLTGVTTV